MAFMAPLMVGTAAAGGAAATAGLIGTAGAVTAGGALSTFGTVMSLMGSLSQADNMRKTAAQNAENARIAAEANKVQTDYAAGQADAAGQHQAAANRRKAELMLSRAQAVAAASGGGPLDESLMSGILSEGETAAGYSLYESSERAKGLRYRGQVGAYEANAKGRSEIESANRQADATVMGGLGRAGMSLFGRFNPGDVPGAYPQGNNPDEYS